MFYSIFLYLTSISGEVLYSVYSIFIVPIQSISRLYICVIVGSRYINPCPYIRALSIDSPEIQSVLYLQLIRIERSLWIRIQISPWRSRSSSRRYLLFMSLFPSPSGSISTSDYTNDVPGTVQINNNAPFKYLQCHIINQNGVIF